ncbi:alpha-galactosidase, partial [Metarhizium brunneum ARSEF 3297]
MTTALQQLKVLQVGKTPNGFNGPAYGWSSFGMSVHSPTFEMNESSIIQQCDVLSSTLGNNYPYCNLDAGWTGPTDNFGRIMYNKTLNLPDLANHLHSIGLFLGVYVVPGALKSDAKKTIYGTDVTIGQVCSGTEGLARCVFNYSRPEVQQWHNSVVAQFASWYVLKICGDSHIYTCLLAVLRGVDLIKLDYVTPGSPPPPGKQSKLPANQSEAVIAYHKAIENSGRQMRLDISWQLDLSEPSFAIWNQNADSMRVDSDIINYQGSSLTSWKAIQRAIDNYRNWTIAALDLPFALDIYADLSSLAVGNNETLAGVNATQQQTIMTHGIASGSNLILDSDLTQLDGRLSQSLLLNASVLQLADFTARYPMQPRNPGTGGQDAKQLQAWIAGPSEDSRAVVVIANYGPDQGQGGFNTSLRGPQQVTVSWTDLGISGCWQVRNAWTDEIEGRMDTSISVLLGEGESVLLDLTYVGLSSRVGTCGFAARAGKFMSRFLFQTPG